MFFGQFLGHGQIDDDLLVTTPVSAHIRYAFVPESKHLARLCARGDFQFLITFQSGNFNFGAQRGLRNVNIKIQEDVILTALEEFMWLYIQ